MNRLRGFTLIEVMLVVGLLFLVISGSVMLYGNLLPLTDLNETSLLVKQQLRKARELSVNGYNNSSHGIYLDSNTCTIVAYQGDSYLERDATKDKNTVIGEALKIESTFDQSDVNFKKWSGMPSQVGEITLSHSNAGVVIVDVNKIGVINVNTKTVN